MEMDYYAFGMTMQGRSFVSKDYRFGYQGSERDKEVNSGAYTTEFRALDVRLGRWFSPDPITHPSWSPYVSMNDNPIGLTDPMGLEPDGPPVSGPNDGCTGSECSAADNAAGLTNGSGNPNGGSNWTPGANIAIDFVGGSAAGTAFKNSYVANSSISDQYYVGIQSVISGSGNQGNIQQNVSVDKVDASALVSHSNRALYSALLTTAYEMYESASNPSLKALTESEKQSEFHSGSSKNTTAILMYEFATGTGKESRTFTESSPITKDIIGGYSIGIAYAAYKASVSSGKKYNYSNRFTIHTSISPDNVIGDNSVEKWVKSIIYNSTTTSGEFWRGGMTFQVYESAGYVFFNVKDNYTPGSGIRNNYSKDRIPGVQTYLGTTYVEFKFAIPKAKLEK